MAGKKRTGLGKGIEAYFSAPGQDNTENSTAAAEPAESGKKAAGSRTKGTAVAGTASKTAAGAGNNSQEEAAVMVRIAMVEPNRSQPRKNFDEAALNELADSIKEYGVLQPILVQDMGDRYEIIAGERRYRAARIAGLKEIPAVIRSFAADKVVELSLIENIQREDLNPIEEAAAYQRLSDEFGLKQEEIADRVFKSRTAVTNALRLLKLSGEVQGLVADGSLSAGHARALVVITSGSEQKKLADIIIEKQLSVRDTEKLVKSYQEAKKAGKKKAGGNAETDRDSKVRLLAIKDLEDRLRSGIGSKVSIAAGKKGGKIEITYHDDDDLERIISLILD